MNLRIVSYNIHKGSGWSITPSTIYKIISQFQKIDTDIILLQEVRGTQFEMFGSECCQHFAYGKNAVYRKGHHGNAILSRFPIIFSENTNISMNQFERRGLLHSIVRLNENNPDLHVLCTHLGLFAKDRRKQLEIIVQYINDKISPYEPIILGGDFNDWSEYATKPLIDHLQFQEAFLNLHRSYARTFPAMMPALKLDRMYFRGLNANYASRLIHKPWRYLSDHIAIDVSLSLVS